MRVRVIWMIVMLAGAFFVPVVSAESLSSTLDAFGAQQPRVHKFAPGFSLSRLAGGENALSDFHGRVVLLTFWATWCAPCRHEMPRIEALWEKYRDHGFTVLAVNVDRGNRSGVADFAHSLQVGFPVLLDPDGSTRNRYEVRALPTSYLIDRDGKIIGRIIGERDWSSPRTAAMMRALLQQGEKNEENHDMRPASADGGMLGASS